MSSPESSSAGALALKDNSTTPSVGLESDHAWEVLLAVRDQVATDLPEDLLRQCYAIQKQFQFDRDEQLPIVRTRRLVESFAEHESQSLGDGQPEHAG